MSHIEITAPTREAATREAMERLQLPLEALDIEWTKEQEDLLAGARPFVQMNIVIRLDYVADKIVAALRGLLEKMGIAATVSASCEDEIVLVSIESAETEVLIGYHGETLDAIQHIVIRMARMAGRDMPLILVDAGEYRSRRIKRLLRVAQSLAELVVKNRQEEEFDPMDSLDRKIVHTLLKGIPGVHSYSRGEGDARQVVVAPDA
jgi:spoIIIJ-associated protein